ncbi:hypothetical protein SLS53_004052 [Cytospora paraplurivora]|uniref:N-acetyltransferase domain-containing protein n=1 Tax=Cytospora paraplurivora TaxID=2898453 RepID=A0AAN9U9N4_9PEZI
MSSTAVPVLFRIRRARPDDAPAIATLGAAVFTSTFKDSGCTPEQLQKFLSETYTPSAIVSEMSDPSKDILVAVGAESDSHPGPDGEAIVGFTQMTRGSHLQEPCARDLAAPVELQRLYVGTGQHGKGVGRALADAVEDLARREGFRHIWLGVWEENHRAQRFYANRGFRRIGEHVFDVGGDLQTDEIMFKAL